MAKKIKIETPLDSFDSPWGGTFQSGDAQPFPEEVTLKVGQEWGHLNSEVERVIKAAMGKRVGCIRIVTSESGNGNVVLGFKNDDDYSTWSALSDDDKWGNAGQALIVTMTSLPSQAGDTRTVRVVLESTPASVQPTTDVTVGIKGISQITYGSTGQTEDVAEELTLHIQTRTSQNGAWISHDTKVIQSNQATFTSVDLKSYLTAGTNYVRLRLSGDDGNGGTVSSVWSTLSLNVVALSLIAATPVATPVTGDSLELRYYIGGAADKTLRLQFGHYVDSAFVADYSYETTPECVVPIGTAVFTSVARVISLTPSDTVLSGILSEGSHVVRAKLYVSEGVQTDWVETEYMAGGNTPTVVVNSIATGVENYTDVVFFKWAASEAMNIRFRLTNAGDTETYATWEAAAEVGTEKALSTQLGISSEQDTVNAYMRIEDLEGNELHDPVFFAISNNQDYAPVSNPAFVLQPSTRSNSESQPRTIVNAATGEIVPSSGWNTFGMVSDGYVDGALVINAGSQLALDANLLRTLANISSAENGLAERNVTIEMEIKAENITDEESPVIRLGSYLSGNDTDIYGLEVRPTEAALLTKNKRVRDDQNVSWAEDRRTRLTFNIVYGLNPENDPQGARLNYARLFVNDTMECEFNYGANDSFIGSEDAQLLLGGTGAKLTIYGIRMYTKALSTNDVMRDYRASLSEISEKAAWLEKNDICGQDGSIDFEKARNAGYNVIGHTGHLPKYGDANKGETEGEVSLLIHISGDPAHSGTLTNLDSKGQGTTAMTYYDWNQQYKVTGETVFTAEDGTVGAAGDGYVLEAGQAAAKKLVGKINFASSMQGHKMGLTRAYDELFKQMVSDGVMSEPSQITRQSNARIAVYEKPFLFFHRETVNDPWTFRYLMTFGAGKGDKPTFGFDKAGTPHMLMVEGADNDRPLALFTAPWNNQVTYDNDNEAWYLGSAKNINFGFGLTAKQNGVEFPSDSAAIDAMKDFWNFVYLHSRNVRFFDGTLSQLRAGSSYAQGDDGYTTPSNNIMYWTTVADQVLGTAKYDLFRYDTVNSQWVPAGINGGTMNVRTQYEGLCTEMSRSQNDWSGMSPTAVTNDVVAIRTAHFAANAATYMHVDDALYHSAFVKFFAGTDNRAKNTYFYTDPTTLKIRFMQDDLDTTIKTNNVGQQRKPYYVEEHDKNAYGEYYWQGEGSGLFNLLETAFSDDLTTTMKRMLTAMAELGGTVMDYLVSRVLQAQDYFPAVAYNEMARLVYERASIAQSLGTYVNNSAQAITQSKGTQRWSEYQWLTDRVMYLSSWCEYGEFSASSDAPGALTFRGQTGTYAFTLKPAKWLYPRVVHGTSMKEATNNAYRVRVPAGQTISYKAFQNDGDTTISIRGIDYYSEIGDMNIPLSASLQTSFQFAGKRLRKVTVNPGGGNTNLFTTQQITISATNIEEFEVRGVDTLTGEIDLSGCTRLQKVDLRGSTPTSVRLPQTATLTTLYLPDNLSTLNLTGMPGLEEVTIEGASRLESINIPDHSAIAKAVAVQAFNDQSASRVLQSVNLTGLQWTAINPQMLVWLAETQNCTLTGTIATSKTPYLTLAQVFGLIRKFGDITSASNSLYISYFKKNIRNIGIVGQKYFTATGNTQWSIAAEDKIGNNIAILNGKPDLHWSFIVDDGNGGEAEVDGIDGFITLTDTVEGKATISHLNAEGNDTRYVLQVAANLTDGTVMTRRWKIGLFNRTPQRGDFAFADGTFDDEPHVSQTFVGYALRLAPISDGSEQVIGYNIIVAASEDAALESDDGIINTSSLQWGVFPSNDNNGINSTIRTEIREASNNITLDSFNTENSGTNDFASEAKTAAMVTRAKSIIIGWVKSLYESQESPTYDECYAIADSAQKILLEYGKAKAFADSLPQSRTELANMMRALETLITLRGTVSGSEVTNPARYQQVFFPAAYACYLYEPEISDGETLNEQYAKEKWQLPALGILKLEYDMYHASRNKTNNAYPNSQYANEDNTVADSDYPLMANILKRCADAGIEYSYQKLWNNGYFWSSSEGFSTSSWNAYFSNGGIYNFGKYYGNVVRAVTAFNYML